MRFFLISDNSDAMNGMRLAGIEGAVVRSDADLKQVLEKNKQERHIRGGMATKRKYKGAQEQLVDKSG